MPGGHRWMYQMTGLPGWMRFGFSPGWAGRSATGLGPGAEFLATGQWPTPQAQAAWQAMQSGQFGSPYAGAAGAGAFAGQPPDELGFLKNQAEFLQSQIDQVQSRIAELEKEE